MSYFLQKRVNTHPALTHQNTFSKFLLRKKHSEYIFPAILHGISSVLSQNGYTPLLSATQNRVDIEREVLKSLMNKPIDGIIVEGTKTAIPNPNIDLYEEIEKQGLTLYGVLPHSDDIYQCDCDGTPSSKLPASNPTKQALKTVLESLGL